MGNDIDRILSAIIKRERESVRAGESETQTNSTIPTLSSWISLVSGVFPLTSDHLHETCKTL